MSEHIDDDLSAGHADGLASVPIKFDKGDVQVVAIEPIFCDNCSPDGEVEEGSWPKPATHAVQIDFRSLGQSTQLPERLCKECAEEVAGRIRESLPDAEEE